MSIKCPYCGGRHTKSDTVRQCAADAGVKPTSLKPDLWLPTLGPVEPVRYLPGKVPAGYYWLDDNLVVKVRILADGRWKGRYFVASYDLVNNTEKSVFPKKDREDFLQWLGGQGVMTFLVRYGYKTGYCPACGGRLTASSERRMGHHNVNGPYGPACMEVVQGNYVIQGG